MAEVGVPQAGVDGKRVALTRGNKAGVGAEVEVEAELQGGFWHIQSFLDKSKWSSFTPPRT